MTKCANVSCLKAYSETDLILSSHYEASAMIPLSVVKRNVSDWWISLQDNEYQ